MRTFNSSLLSVWLILCSSSALAASASAYMDNFSLAVTGGSITQFNNSQFDTTVTIWNDLQHNYSFFPYTDYSFSISSYVTNGLETSSSGIAFGQQDADSYANANGENFSTAMAYFFYSYNYQANTNVVVSLDAFTGCQPDTGSNNLGWSVVGINFMDTNNEYDVFSQLGESQTTLLYTYTERLTATYITPIDAILRIGYAAGVRINGAPVTPTTT